MPHSLQQSNVPTAGGTACRVHRPHTSSTRAHPSVNSRTTHALSSHALAHPHGGPISPNHQRREGRAVRTSRLSCATPAPAPSDRSQRTSYTLQQLTAGRAAQREELCEGALQGGGVCAVPHSVSESGRVHRRATVFTPALLHCHGRRSRTLQWQKGQRAFRRQVRHLAFDNRSTGLSAAPDWSRDAVIANPTSLRLKQRRKRASEG